MLLAVSRASVTVRLMSETFHALTNYAVYATGMESSFGCHLLISLCLEAEKLGALVMMILTPVIAHILLVFCKWLILSESA